MTDRVLMHLSMAAKAGKVKSGEVAAEQAVKAGRAYLLVIAGDASENTKKKFRNMAAWNETPLLEYADREAIGRAIGKAYRSAAAVTDEGLADLIRSAAHQPQNRQQEGVTYGKNQGI